ncbi:hypothetical protein AB3S75_010754 [Citrus x aurantiifolia]
MASKLAAMVPFSCILVLMLLGLASSNIDQDKAECADKVVALATCLPYVGGDAKTPTVDCCGGLKQLLDKSKKCLCLLIKDKDDPSLGLKINSTLAANLPTACHSPANVTECINLLHLPPNSPDAKVFQGFSNLTQGHGGIPATAVSSNSKNGSPSADQKSDGGKASRLLGLEMACGALACIFFSLHLVSSV